MCAKGTHRHHWRVAFHADISASIWLDLPAMPTGKRTLESHLRLSSAECWGIVGIVVEQHMNTCIHEFVTSGLYLMRATSWEEPTFYPPSGTLPVEHCAKCGVLRLSVETLESVKSVQATQKPLLNRLD